MTPNPLAVPAQLAQLAGRPDVPLPEVFRRVCETAAEALRVERAGVWLFVNEDRALRCVSLFERSKRRHSKGGCLPVTDFPVFRRAIATAPLLPCESARSDPRTAELNESYLAPHGIASVLDAPVLRDGRVVGLVCHEHVGTPRSWTDEDRTFAVAVAELLAGRMKAAEGALRTATQHSAGPSRSDGAAHDLRNVLTEILAHAELLGMTCPLPPAAAARLAGITAAAEQGVALVRRMFEPTRAPDRGDAEHAAPTPRSDRAEHQPRSGDDGTAEHESLPPDKTG